MMSAGESPKRIRPNPVDIIDYSNAEHGMKFPNRPEPPTPKVDCRVSATEIARMTPEELEEFRRQCHR